MKKIIILLALVVAFGSSAQAETVVEIVTADGTKLTSVCYDVETGDEYISTDNRLYRIISVQDGRAVAENQGDVTLPDVGWLDADAALPVTAMGEERRIALYCTHSDESYEPSDGHYSDNERGSIYQIASMLGSELESNGIDTEVSDALHYPHDAGAYRRSRQTAVELLKFGPDALLDVHRDGIPDPDEYTVTIGGKDVSKIRLLVGRGNQNMAANKDFALTVKAVADKVYPGLIKDIYMGKGAFNQDLYPRALLLECGTYTLEKRRVLASMPMLSDTLTRAMYGGVTGSAGTSDTRAARSIEPGGETEGQPDNVPAKKSSTGAGSGILWAVGLLVIGLVIYGVVATGSFQSGMKKAERNISEMTGGLVGKKPDKKDETP